MVTAIVVPLGLLIVVGVILTWQILRMMDLAHWVDHSDEVLTKIYDARTQIVDQETSLRGYLLTEDHAFLEPYERARPIDLFDDLHDFVSDNPGQQRRIDVSRDRYQDWLRVTAPIAEPSAKLADFRTAKSLDERRRRMDKVREAITAFVEAELDLRHTRSAASEASYKATLWTAGSLFAALSVLLAFLSRRQLATLAQTYNAALSGERAVRTEVEGQSWVRSQQVKLSEGVQGDPPLDELGRRVLERLAPSVGAVVGAFHVAEPGGFRRTAGYALDTGSTPDFFAHGEGVLGRVAIDKKMLLLSDVPHEFLNVRSGTGESTPVSIVVMPALMADSVLAVVELGFFVKPTAVALDLLERVGETIAFAVRSVEQKSRLRDLLEEAQRQGEELQAQQEELRVANEELQEQSEALRTTQAALEERKEELEVSNSSLVAQRDALAGAQRSLQDKAIELERASRYKSEFLANMSHELRTPLNSSLILAKLLADNKDQNLTSEQVKFANTIYAAGNDLLALINDILDLAKIESGKMDVDTSRLALRELVQPIVSTFEPVAQDRKLELEVDIGRTMGVFIETDVQRVHQILKNLLSNAFKFTERGKVSLAVEPDEQSCRFIVRDTGIGIPAHQHQIVFEAFRQADGTTNRRFGGTGLGLSISRDLARMLGGDLTLESEAGRGSTFTLTLPLRHVVGAASASPSALHPPAPRAATQPAVVQLPPPSAAPMPELAINRASEVPAFPDDRSQIDRQRRLLLIVEDDIPFAEILANLAREMEFQFLVAHTADEGVRLAAKYLPSAVILDMKLPDHSGLSVLDRIKRNPSTRHVPVHVISVSDYAQVALSMGAVGYMLKPVKREELVGALSKLKERFARLRRLLVIEDDGVQRDAIKHLLQSDDVEIITVATVERALAELRSKTFDCVVTDLTLPDGSGYDLLAQLAADEAYAFPPVIVYTGRQLTTEEEQNLRRFSSSIIVKGVRSPERLLDEVTLFLHRVESELPPEHQRMLRQARDREAAFDGCNVLLVEDDVRNIFALSHVLEPKGAKVTIARNGREAIEQLEQHPELDLVLMDIMMPEMDGIEAMRAIRKRSEPWSKVPIIALTAKAMRDDQERCMQAGANDYIAKPLDVEMLLSLMRVWMPKR